MDENGLCVDWFVLQWSASQGSQCFGGRLSHVLGGVDPDREAQIDLTDILELGD